MKYKNKSSVPTSSVLIGYKDLFELKTKTQRIDLLKGVCKTHIIAELAGLNYRIKGYKNKILDTNFETQQDELFYFCGKNEIIYKKYAHILDLKIKGRKSFIFSRQTCLFALEEISQLDLLIIPEFKMSDKISHWESILLYILQVNDEVTKIDESLPNQPINFETLNPKLLPISELMIINDPFYIVYRGWNLLIYLTVNIETRSIVKNYFEETYNTTYERFLYEILRMWMANNQEKDELKFYYILPENEKFKHLFDKLSDKFINSETYKLLNIRKNPFFKSEENTYVLTDLSNLLDKVYYQFINDFYFDKLRLMDNSLGKKFTMQDYKAIIGKFFEEYVNDKITYSFMFSNGFIIKTFNQLLVKKKGNLEIEIGDLYLRHENKVIFGEVKSSSIYDEEKYGGNIDKLYKNNRNLFFKTFGVNQLAANIKALEENIEIVDIDFKNRKKIRLWPVIIFNEKAFQTPFMSQIFNERFKELMIDYNNKRIHVYPLVLLHISDLENMEVSLNKNPDLIWELLSKNFTNESKFIPPFYFTLNGFDIRADYKRFRDKVEVLFEKFDNKNQIPTQI